MVISVTHACCAGTSLARSQAKTTNESIVIGTGVLTRCVPKSYPIQEALKRFSDEAQHAAIATGGEINAPY